MTKKSTQELTGELIAKVQKMKLNDAAAIFGTTSKELILQDLHRAVGEFADARHKKVDYDTLMHRYETVAAQIDAAGISGLISEAELPAYYTLVDDIWEALETENNAK